MSLDYSIFLEAVKRAALEAVRASKPFGLAFGVVTGEKPLKIMVDQKLLLGEGQIVLTSAVRDTKVFMTVDHLTEDATHTHEIHDSYSGGGTASSEAHEHAYRGKKEFLLHRALKKDERVLLLRADGGQKYIVLDRLEGAHDTADGTKL